MPNAQGIDGTGKGWVFGLFFSSAELLIFRACREKDRGYRHDFAVP